MPKKITKSSNYKIKSVGIIGVGKLGATLCFAFDILNILKLVVSRNEKKISHLQKHTNSNFKGFNSINEINVFPNIIFITVPDAEIKNIAQELASKFPEKLSKTIFIHCSGTLGLDVLEPLKDTSEGIAVMHPFQTFFNYDAIDLMEIAWTIECSEHLKPVLKNMIEPFEAKITFVDEIRKFDKKSYHLSAIFASNYLANTMFIANKLAVQTGIEAEKLIYPISTTAIENSMPETNLYEFALTGPISRGDIDIVAKHIKSLKNDKLTLKNYILMGLATTETAYSELIISENIYLKLRKLFFNEIIKVYL